MTVISNCPGCGAECEFDDAYKGYAGKCPACGKIFLAAPPPAPENETPSDPLPGFYHALFRGTLNIFLKPPNYLFISLLLITAVFKFFVAGSLCADRLRTQELSFMYFGGMFLKIILWAVLLSFYYGIIRDTAFGLDDLSDDVEDFLTAITTAFASSVALPLLLFYYALIAPMLPFFAGVLIVRGLGLSSASLWSLDFGPVLVLQILFIAGLFLFPIALLTAAVGESILLMRPDYLIRPVVQAWRPYLVVFAIVATATVLWCYTGDYEIVYDKGTAALVYRLALTIAFQFVAIIMMRAIGLYCRHYRCFLPW